MANMVKELGEPIKYDPDFKGPIHNRSCTDILWLLLFIAFLGVWVFIGYYGAKNGDIQTLLAPIDSKGRHCGLSSGVEDKKYLLFFNIAKCLQPGTPITGCPTPQVCVKQCPSNTVIFESELTASTFPTLKKSMVCTDEVNMDLMTYDDAVRYIKEEKCANYILKSQAVLFRCIGDLSAMPKCSGPTTPSTWLQREPSGQTCLRDPKTAQKSLMNSATALDSYIGWIAASWVTFFARDERDTHVVGSSNDRCILSSTRKSFCILTTNEVTQSA